MLEKFLIKAAFRIIASLWNQGRLDASYADLQQYGIADILINEQTKEPMFIIDGTDRPKRTQNV